MADDRDRAPYNLVDTPPDERSTRPADESLAEARRGRASLTPFATIGGVALVIGVVAGLLVLVTVLVYVL